MGQQRVGEAFAVTQHKQGEANMSDRNSAEIFARVLTAISEKLKAGPGQVEEDGAVLVESCDIIITAGQLRDAMEAAAKATLKKLAGEVWRMSDDYDFTCDQLDMDVELEALGLATRHPTDGIVYAPTDGR